MVPALWSHSRWRGTSFGASSDSASPAVSPAVGAADASARPARRQPTPAAAPRSTGGGRTKRLGAAMPLALPARDPCPYCENLAGGGPAGRRWEFDTECMIFSPRDPLYCYRCSSLGDLLHIVPKVPALFCWLSGTTGKVGFRSGAGAGASSGDLSLAHQPSRAATMLSKSPSDEQRKPYRRCHPAQRQDLASHTKGGERSGYAEEETAE
jgi:hypothetical protein